MDQFIRFNKERKELRPVGNSINDSNYMLLANKSHNNSHNNMVENVNQNKDKLFLNKSSSMSSSNKEDNNANLVKVKASKVYNMNSKQFQENGIQDSSKSPQLLIDQNNLNSKKVYAEDDSENQSVKKLKSKRKLTKRDKIVNLN
jgi:hypothetical protein